jgi:hypothetical protein
MQLEARRNINEGKVHRAQRSIIADNLYTLVPAQAHYS